MANLLQQKMITIQTEQYQKYAHSSVDDQPNYVNRDQKGQGYTLLQDRMPESKSQVKDEWNKKKKKKKKKRNKGRVPVSPDTTNEKLEGSI